MKIIINQNFFHEIPFIVQYMKSEDNGVHNIPSLVKLLWMMKIIFALGLVPLIVIHCVWAISSP